MTEAVKEASMKEAGIAASSLVIYGGTFDPVHFGHLRSAVEVAQSLGAPQVNLMPAYVPPHRDNPTTHASQRVEMLELATEDSKLLQVDSREIRRQGHSYTFDTLKEIREEAGSDQSVSIVLGADAYMLLHEWYAWMSITDLAHIVILERPGFMNANPVQAVSEWSTVKLVDDPGLLCERPSGLICRLKLSQFEVSATKIREMIRQQLSIDYLLPKKVIDYIDGNGLYR